MPSNDNNDGKPLRHRNRRSHTIGGFTLAEVLAAMAFMAIVIPVAVEGLRIATQAGQAAHRRLAASRIAERVLNEFITTEQSLGGNRTGRVLEEGIRFDWTIRSGSWGELSMRTLIAQVRYETQGRPEVLEITTLAEPAGTP